jgi:alpha-methylacyl-CoA racemase
MAGPLVGVKVLELAGIGPGPFAAMMLADMGAEVVRIDRVDTAAPSERRRRADVLGRGRRSIAVDLKHEAGVGTLLRMVQDADVLLEGFRPGVAERLGIGPDECLASNRRLVYGRMTGWGQHGPLSTTPGHDINYIALAGALDGIGRVGQPPTPPLNLVGDFGGGGMFLIAGVLAALLERERSGMGQVIDAAMVDGAAVLMAMFYGLAELGAWQAERGTNSIDSGSHFYDVYECSDGRYVAIGAVERQFYAELRNRLGLDDDRWDSQMERTAWPDRKNELAELFRSRTRAEWCEVLEGTDACFAPVLSMDEAHEHPHNVERKTFSRVDGVLQPAPAPRFSRTPTSTPRGAALPGEHSVDILRRWGFDAPDIEELLRVGAVADGPQTSPDRTRSRGEERR